MNLRTFIPLIVAAAFSVAPGFAESGLSEEVKNLLLEDRSRAAVNTHSYEFDEIHDTPAPKGYKPFYISHYGRHGSRTDWGGFSYQRLVNILTRAEEEGILTEDGKDLLEGAKKVFATYNGMDGRLTDRGVREHYKLAERMYRRYPGIFRKNKHIRAISSTSQRCIVSMAGFTNGLTATDNKLSIEMDTGDKYMEYINNEAPNELKAATQPVIDSINRMYQPNYEPMMKAIFTDTGRGQAIAGSLGFLESAIWSTAKIGDACDVESDLFRFLSDEALFHFYEQTVLDLYLRHCNSVEFGYDRILLSEPLVEDIVNKAEEVIAGGGYAADLRFGHDWPMLSFASYIGIEGPGDHLTVDEARADWKGFFNVPFAVNLQMVFYRNKQGDVLVKFLYNEKEVLLRGLEPVTGPYYSWETFKQNTKGYLR